MTRSPLNDVDVVRYYLYTFSLFFNSKDEFLLALMEESSDYKTKQLEHLNLHFCLEIHRQEAHSLEVKRAFNYMNMRSHTKFKGVIFHTN